MERKDQLKLLFDDVYGRCIRSQSSDIIKVGEVLSRVKDVTNDNHALLLGISRDLDV